MSNSYEIKGAMAGIEVRELQEEEKHIQILKQQIEKIEQYKNVMRKKDKQIDNLKKDTKKVKGLEQENSDLKETVQTLRAQLQQANQYSNGIQTQVQVKTQEYEITIKELESRLTAENESKNNDLREYKRIVQQLNGQNEELRSELGKFDEEIKTAEEVIKTTVSKCKDKESSLQSQEQFYQQREKQMIDEIAMLTHEKDKASKTSVELYQVLQEVEDKIKNIPILEEELSIEREKVDELEAKLSSLEKNMENEKDTTNEEVELLRSELERATVLVSRQESIILELRTSRQDLEAEFRAINSKQATYESEMTSMSKKFKSKLKTYQANEDKLREVEAVNTKLTIKNEELLRQLQDLVDGYEEGNIVKQQWVNKREQLVNRRNAEIERLTSALDDIPDI